MLQGCFTSITFLCGLTYSVGQQHSWQALSAFSLVTALVGGTKTNVYKKSKQWQGTNACYMYIRSSNRQFYFKENPHGNGVHNEYIGWAC